MFPKVYKEFKPDHHLAQHVKCYWVYEKEFASGEFEHVLPDSSYELVYVQAGGYRVGDNVLPRLFLVGHLNKPLDFYATGVVKQWCIRFYPWGFRPFGNVERLARHEWLPATDAMDEETCMRLEQIMQNEDAERVTKELDSYLTELLLKRHFDDKVLNQAFRKLQKQKGDIKIRDLANFCFISTRHLHRKVATATGKSPREIASRLRFEKTRDVLMHSPDTPLAHLASEHGYTDQSHLVKEFRNYMDMAPSRYAELVRKQQPQMKNIQNVLFLQDDSAAF
ncbi:MAG TPA: helix-turn-helix transcriptional regulator [Candidatus Saccharimonadales bacterium]|nr:helix-turn-helix transcriptional regulator [Candidatus Saccharimonadales bacterium]